MADGPLPFPDSGPPAPSKSDAPPSQPASSQPQSQGPPQSLGGTQTKHNAASGYTDRRSMNVKSMGTVKPRMKNTYRVHASSKKAPHTTRKEITQVRLPDVKTENGPYRSKEFTKTPGVIQPVEKKSLDESKETDPQHKRDGSAHQPRPTKLSFKRLQNNNSKSSWRVIRNHILIYVIVEFMNGYSTTVSTFKEYGKGVEYQDYAKCIQTRENRTSLPSLYEMGLHKAFEGSKTFYDALNVHRTKKMRRLQAESSMQDMISRFTGVAFAALLIRQRNRHVICLGVTLVTLGFLMLSTDSSEITYRTGYYLINMGQPIAYYYALLNSFDSLAYWTRILCYMATELSYTLGEIMTIALLHSLTNWKWIFPAYCALTIVILVTVYLFTKTSHTEVLLSLNVNKIMHMFGIEKNTANQDATERLLEATLYTETPPSNFLEFFKMISRNPFFIVSTFFYAICSAYKFQGKSQVAKQSIHLHLQPIPLAIVNTLSKTLATVISYAIMRFFGLRRAFITVCVLVLVSTAGSLSTLSQLVYDHCFTAITYDEDAKPHFLSDRTVFIGIYIIHVLTMQLRAFATTVWFFEWIPPTIRRHAFFMETTLILFFLGILTGTSKQQNVLMYETAGMAAAAIHVVLLPFFFYFFRCNGVATFAELDGKRTTVRHVDEEEDAEDFEEKFREG